VNRLRFRGVYVFAVGGVPALSVAFQWDDFIAYALVFTISLVYLGITDRESKAATLRSCLLNLISTVVLVVILTFSAAALFLLGQKFGISGDQVIYLISAAVCLVGLAMFIWSFRPAPDLVGKHELPTKS
jgi:hypothetical protein